MASEKEALVTKTNDNRFKRAMGWLALLIVVAAGVGAGIFWWNQIKTYVTTDNAKVTGDIVDISPKISGRLEKLLVKEGDHVKAGQVIARLDNDQYKTALKQAEAGLELARANYERLPEDIKSLAAGLQKAKEAEAAAQAQVESARIALKDAERSLIQSETLFDAQAIAKENLLAAQSRYTTCRSALDAAEANARAAQAAVADAQAKWEAAQKSGVRVALAQVKQAEAAYRLARLNYANSLIKSPINGRVIRISVAVGENVAVGQTLIQVCDLSSTWVTANIDENKISRIKVGQGVEVTLDAYPGRVFKGRVAEIGGATQSTFALIPTENTSGNFTKVTQRVPVKITVDATKVELRPGLSARVRVRTSD